MTLAPGLAEFLARQPLARAASLADIRAETDRALAATQAPPEAVERVDDLAVEGGEAGVVIPVKAYRPARAAPGAPPAMVFAHAGGWCLVSLETYDAPCRALANATGCVVFSVGYRLAPEHPYPYALEDVYRVLRWVAGHAAVMKIDARRIVIAGDSAGGNLAAAAALMARDRHGPPIAHQLLIYPALDTDFATPSYEAFAEGYYLTREAMRFCWDAYLGARLSAPPAYAAPLRADLFGLPPATILVNEYDPLRSEGEAYARKLRAQGVAADLILLEGMIHASIHMLGVTPAARALFDRAGDAIRRTFALASR